MTSPTAVGMGGIGASLLGGLFSAFGAAKEGTAQQQMYNYQAQVARINSQIDQQNREYALQQGDISAEQYGMKAAQTMGAIRTGYGAGNIDVSSGSAADVQRSEGAITALDMSQIRANAAKTAYDYQVRSTTDTNQATLDTMAGVNAKVAGGIKAASSILGTTGSVASKWYQGSSSGMWATV